MQETNYSNYKLPIVSNKWYFINQYTYSWILLNHSVAMWPSATPQVDDVTDVLNRLKQIGDITRQALEVPTVSMHEQYSIVFTG